ncbi:glycogen synthase GlgA [candidate division KSB1 bacterium]|nr:glycogen synthase GlgA [candidate division KSB1 bacterium]
MRIAFATSECVPFVKTGGLADVSGALPKALALMGHEVKVFLPLYQSIRVLDHDLTFAHEFHNTQMRVGERTVTANVWYKRNGAGVEHYFVDCPHYFHRGQVYTSHADEDERFILLQDMAMFILQRFNWAPEVLHCNDWQTALLPVFLREKYNWDQLFAKTASVLSLHNVGYQGRFGAAAVGHAGLKYDKFHLGGAYEFYGDFSFLKAGLMYADMITTVSPTYAREIQTYEYGTELEGVLRYRGGDLVGILNGIDVDDWNPAGDRHIPHHYTIDDLDTKRENKRALLERTDLPYQDGVPTIGIITRLAEQKGMELVASVLPQLMELPVQLVALGSGAQKYEDFFRWAAQTYPEKCYAYIGFNDALAHLITAGSDMFLMPSRYEPCGLNQMYCLNYGTVPIVRRTGGLADTVRDYHEYNDQGNGFSFYDFTPYALWTSILRALDLYQQKEVWREIMRRGMSEDFSWKHSAQQYLEVYQRAISKRG